MRNEFNLKISERELITRAAIDPASLAALIDGHYSSLQKRTEDKLRQCIRVLATEILHDALLEVIEQLNIDHRKRVLAPEPNASGSQQNIDCTRPFDETVMDAVYRKIENIQGPSATVPLHHKSLKNAHAYNADPVDTMLRRQSSALHLSLALTEDGIAKTKKALTPIVKPFMK